MSHRRMNQSVIDEGIVCIKCFETVFKSCSVDRQKESVMRYKVDIIVNVRADKDCPVIRGDESWYEQKITVE